MQVPGVLGGDHAAFGDPPQQVCGGLVSDEELGQRIHLGEHGLGVAPRGPVIGLVRGELGVGDEVGQQPTEDVAVVRGGVAGGPCLVESGAQVRQGRGHPVSKEGGEPVHGLTHLGEAFVAGAGEDVDAHVLVAGELVQVPGP